MLGLFVPTVPACFADSEGKGLTENHDVPMTMVQLNWTLDG